MSKTTTARLVFPVVDVSIAVTETITTPLPDMDHGRLGKLASIVTFVITAL